MKFKILIVAAIAAICVTMVMTSHYQKNPKDAETNTEAQAETQAEADTSVNVRTLTLTAAGDCTLATDDYFDISDGFVTYAENNGTAYFLQNVRGLFAGDDITLVNLECALSDNGSREDKQFAFRGDPSYVNVLTSASVEAANLANNHSLDYGKTALEDTQTLLEQNGIITCRGKGNVTVGDINGITVGFVGINYLNDEMKTELTDAITMAKNAGAELVILSIHWGIERENYPESEQIEAAHRAIDCGADIVIGTHPHVLQGIEKYNGRYICYSLGNFCFGGNSDPSDKDTAIFRQTFTFDENGLRDDDNITIYPCRISGHDGYNDYQPKLAEGEQRDNIIERLTRYSAEIGNAALKFN